MQQLLSQKEAATMLRVSHRTLEHWRHYGGGPAFKKLGRRVVYAVADLESFVTAQTRISTSDDGTFAHTSKKKEVHGHAA